MRRVKRFIRRWKWSLGTFSFIAVYTVAEAFLQPQYLIRILAVDATMLALALSAFLGSRRSR